MEFLRDLSYAVGIVIAAAFVLMFLFYVATFVLPVLTIVGIIVVVMVVLRADREGR